MVCSGAPPRLGPRSATCSTAGPRPYPDSAGVAGLLGVQLATADFVSGSAGRRRTGSVIVSRPLHCEWLAGRVKNSKGYDLGSGVLAGGAAH